MSKTSQRFILILFSFNFILFISACKKETVVAPSLTFNYFPIEKGKWVEYIVDSVYHAENDNNNDDSVYTYHFEIREEIDSTYKDVTGRENQIVKRYHRLNDTEPWLLTEVWTQTLSQTSAYRTEENISFHKLSFPINSIITWNGNDANTFDEEIYNYEYYHQPEVVNSLSFDSTISVIQIDENNFVEKIYGNEIYAAGVGLIFKERDELGKRNGLVVKGLEFRMQVKAYGDN